MFGKFLGITGLEDLKYLGAECTRCGTLVMLVPEKVDLSGSGVPLDCPSCRHADKDTTEALGQVRENVQSLIELAKEARSPASPPPMKVVLVFGDEAGPSQIEVAPVI